MTPLVDLAGSLKRQNASAAAGFAAVLIASAALTGWWTKLPLLSTSLPGLSATSPLGALCMALLGVSLVAGPEHGFGFAAALTGTTVALVNLGLTLFGIDLGMGLAMPAATALGLALAGSAIVLSRFDRHDLAEAALTSLVGAIAVLALLGHLTGVHTLYSVTSIRSPPLPVVAGLLCIACGIILRLAAKPALRRPRPLWHLLAVLGWAIVTPLMLFGAYASARMADAQLNQVRQELIDDARTLSVDVDREIMGEIETLEALAASPSLQHGDFAAFQRQAEAPLTLRQSGNIVLFDPDARQIVNTSVPFGTPLPPGVIQEPVKRAIETGKTQVTGLYLGPVAREVLFSIVLPVKVNGVSRYALARSPSQHALARVVAATPLPPGRNAAVFDAARRIIARAGKETPETAIGREVLPSQWGTGSTSDILEFTDAEGQPSLQAYARSELTGWETAVWAPKAVLGAPLKTLWQTLGWMALLAFALVAALASWLGRIIARSVGDAAHAATALGEGRPLPPSATPIAEVNTLMAELEETAAKRKAAEGSVRDSERRLQLALAAAQLGSWHYDPCQRMFSGDARAREILDFSGDGITAGDLLERIHPNDAERVSMRFLQALDSDIPKRTATEFRYRLRQGGFRWLETLGLTHFEGAGPERRAMSAVGTVADVTARKEMEEENRARAQKEHLIMREMHHRAKNMLSVVDAIAHQTATRSPQDFVARFSERIQALSANQDLLVRNEWKGVEIKGLVQAQLAHFADLIGSRIAVDGPALCLTAASAQAVGLALHELATNAGKYGALSTDKGCVDIWWGLEEDTFAISWTERGGPPVSAPKRRGFGSIVMGVMAERSVGGKVDVDYPPTGLTWRLTCPAANALEACEIATLKREQVSPGRMSA